jgi:hypothetical protein
MKDACVIVTCMGRLLHLRRTIDGVLAEHQGRYVLVDYSCPDRCGAWVKSTHPRLVEEGRLLVARVPHERHFHKTKAWNVGAQLAARVQAEWLCFLDADTIVTKGFWPWLEAHASHGRFFIAGLSPDGKDVPPLVGVLVVRREDFERVGGFDESFRGWGCEDIDMRLRLAEHKSLRYGRIPVSFFSFLEHHDDLRTRFYPMPDIRQSEAINDAILRRKLRRRTGLDLEQLTGQVLDMLPRRWVELQALRQVQGVKAPRSPHAHPSSAGARKVRGRWR